MFFKHCLLLVVVVVLVHCKEHVNHGPHVPHKDAEGHHNEAFDHEAVLGSEDLEDVFAGLEPEEAKTRLLVLAQQHDLDGDGFINKTEMYSWMVASFLSLDREEADEKFEEEDSNQDGQVTVEEFLDKSYGYSQQDVEDMRKAAENVKDGGNEEEKEQIRMLKMVDEDLRRFRGADLNADGTLDKEEYSAFFFPSNYPHMHQFELELYLEENDRDGDGKISKDEFVRDPVNDEARITGEENFKDLDKDEDGYLTTEEIKSWVVPDSDEMAQEEGDHLFGMADTNQDDMLSMEEIAAKTHEFVGSSATDYGNILRHEEL